MRKRVISFFILAFLFVLNPYAQVIGSRDNSALIPSTVSPSQLSGGGFSGDVNVFNGSYNASYPIGAVATPGGLSFALNLSYSASYSAGTSPAVCSGIPYGEGWNVSVPMITASNAAYFSFMQSYECYVAGKFTKDSTNYYNGTIEVDSIMRDASKLNGDVFWFSPKVSIPGVASGRAVFKYIDDDDANCAVFTLNKFERYVELRYYGSKWQVIADNGDMYEFNVPLVTYRSPNNQRILNYNGYNAVIGNEVADIIIDNDYGGTTAEVLNSIEPKQSYTSWYCSNIRNRNLPGQYIVFQYEKFGGFNYFKEFEQTILADKIGLKLSNITLGEDGTDFTAYRDILLTKVTSYVSNTRFEIVDLGYGLIDQIGTRMLDPTDADVFMKDSLYAYKTVFSDGVGADDFEDWKRYYHGKSDGAYNLVGPEPVISNRNPYITSNNGTAGDGYIRGNVADDDDISFDHAFLESPRLLRDQSSLVAGDIYEIKTTISDNNAEHAMGNGTIDIAVVTGDLGFEMSNYRGVPDTIGNCKDTAYTALSYGISYNSLNAIGPVLPEYNYRLTRSEQIFSTQNQAIKWQIPSAATSISTSNYFVMPDVPVSYDGLNIQIGPGNSDTEYNAQNFEGGTNSINVNEGGAIYPSAYNAYSHALSSSTALAAYERIPNSFGIGVPWSMTVPLYIDQMGGVSGTNAQYTDAYKFWWDTEEDDNPWENRPTKLNESVKLKEVEVIRYSKVPYMLKKVEMYRVNGEVSPLHDTSGLVLISSNVLEYSMHAAKTIENYPYEYKGNFNDSACYVPDADTLIIANLKPTYVYTLDNVKTLPVAGWEDNPTVAETYTDSTLLQTDFEYDWYGFDEDEIYTFQDGHPGRKTRVLTKYIDQLGGETHIAYYPRQSQATLKEGRYYAIPGCAQYNVHRIMGQSFAFDIHPAVHYLTKLDEKNNVTANLPGQPLKRWEYVYDTTSIIHQTFDYVLPGKFRGGYTKSYSKGFAETTVYQPRLDSDDLSKTIYYHHGNVYAPTPYGTDSIVPDASTETEYLYFGKIKRIKQYNYAGQIEEESIFEYGHTKAHENGYARNRMLRDNLISPTDYDGLTNYVHARNYEYADYRRDEEEIYSGYVGHYLRLGDGDPDTDLVYTVYDFLTGKDTLIKESLHQNLALLDLNKIEKIKLIGYSDDAIPAHHLKDVPVTGPIIGAKAKPIAAQQSYVGATWGNNYEKARFLETFFYKDLHASNPDYYFHSYFIKTQKETKKSYDDYERIEMDGEGGVVDIPEGEAVRYRDLGDPYTNPIVTTVNDNNYIAAINNSTDGTNIQNYLVTNSPLSETVLANFESKIGQFQSVVIRNVLVAQPALSDARLQSVFNGLNSLSPGDAHAIFTDQPYLSDDFLLNAIPGMSQQADGLMIQLFLHNAYLSDTVMIEMAQTSGFSQNVLKQVLGSQQQGQLSEPVLGAITAPANGNAGFAMEFILLMQPILSDSILRNTVNNTNASAINVMNVYTTTPVYPSDNALLDLLNRDPSVNKNDLVDLLLAGERYFGDSLLNAINLDVSELDAERIADAQNSLYPYRHFCDNEIITVGRSYIASITEYEYYEANYDGTTLSEGYKNLMGLNDIPGKFVPGTISSLGKDITLNTIELKHQPSWQLFRTKTYSPEYPGAYQEQEYYYYFDLLNRMSRHFEYYDLESGNFHFVEDNELDYYPADTIVFNYNWPHDHQEASESFGGHLPLTGATKNSRRNNLRNVVFQSTTRTKNNQNEPAIERSEYYEYDSQWNRNLPQQTIVETYNGPTCEEGEEEQGCIFIKHAGDIDEVMAQVPWGYCAYYANGGVYACPTDFPIYSSDYTGVDLIDCNPTTVDPTDTLVKAIDAGTMTDRAMYLRSVVVQIDTLSMFEGFYADLRMDESNTNVLDFYLTDVVDEYSRRESRPLYPYDTLTVRTIDERNWFAQVQLEHNQSSIYTRYDYNNSTRIWHRNTNNGPGCSGYGNYSTYLIKDLGLPTGITVGVGREDSLFTRYHYYPNLSLDSIVNPWRHTMHYTYDDYDRLHQTFDNGRLMSQNNYYYWKRDTALNFSQRTAQNYVETYVHNNATAGPLFEGEHIRAYIDPLGRNFSTSTSIDGDSTQVHSGTVLYDNWGRTSRAYKPYKLTNQSVYLPSTDTTLAYTHSRYEKSQKSRTLRTAKYGITAILDTHTIKQNYKLINEVMLACELDLDAPAARLLIHPNLFANHAKYMRVETEDEDGKRMIVYTNSIGQQVATKQFGENTADELITLFVYDNYGNLTTVINPAKQKSHYAYNLLGQLYQQTTLDAGTTKYMYNKQGLLSVEQDELGRQGAIPPLGTDTVRYFRKYTYDDYGKLAKVKRHFWGDPADYVNNNPDIEPLFYRDTVAGFDTTTGTPTFGTDPETYFSYVFSNNSTYDWRAQLQCVDLTDLPDETHEIVTHLVTDFISPLGFTEKAYHYGDTGDYRELGKPTLIISYDQTGHDVERREFNYNEEEQLAEEKVSFNPLGVSNPEKDPNHSVTATLKYPSYNYRGSINEMHVDVYNDGILDFKYTYEYDDWNRLRSIYVSYDTAHTGTKVVSYAYDDALGLLTETKHLVNSNCGEETIQTISYAYDLRDRLTAINSELFNYHLFYDDNAPLHADFGDTVNFDKNWNGNINGVTADYGASALPVNNAAALDDVFSKATVYGYTYDQVNRLTNADAWVGDCIDPAYYSTFAIGDATYNFDKIGNLTNLQRGIYVDAATHELVNEEWNYNYNEHTNQLTKVEGVGVTADRNYTYDANGNLSTDDHRNLSNINYGRRNYPFHITKGSSEISYLYSIDDQRIYKENATATDTTREYYLNNVGILDITADNWIWYVQGADRVAKVVPTTNQQPKNIATATALQLSDTLQTSFYLYDHLGNTRVVYNAVGTVCGSDIAYTVEYAGDYFPYGKTLREYSFGEVEKFLTTQHERDQETGLDYRGARFYDSDVARFLSLDPLAADYPSLSDYSYVAGNPISFIDPTGMAVDDWVQNSNGNIYWDKNANDQESTKEGDSYLGKTLTFVFNSYIDADLWDGPGGDMPAGDKLTSTITITGNENSDGELIGIGATKSVKIGITPVGTARDYFPGLGDDQNKFSYSGSLNEDGTLSSGILNFEQHASVPFIELMGLSVLGHDVVNVAQNLTLSFSNNNLSLTAETDIFPSATLTLNGVTLFKYNQPSFVETHSIRYETTFGDDGRGGSSTQRRVSSRPSPNFYLRYSNP